MDKDWIAGAGKQLKGTLKDTAGKVTGDAELQADGKGDKAAGRLQTAAGRARDGVRGMADT